MKTFRFQKEQKAIYVETQDFDVIAEDHEQAKAIATEMINKLLEDSDHIDVGKWELDHNSYAPYPVELNGGNPTVRIYDTEQKALIDNSPLDSIQVPSEHYLNAWWAALPNELKDVFHRRLRIATAIRRD